MVNEPKADVVYLLTYEGFTLRYAYCNVVCLARDGWPGCARSHGPSVSIMWGVSVNLGTRCERCGDICA